MFDYEYGIRLRNADLWLDATRNVTNACVSHGHADHIRRHKHTFATPTTASFMRRRLGDIPITAVEFDSPISAGPYRLTFLPAGHILGSAQIFVETEDKSLLYSGDFKLGPSATAEALRVHQSEVLIMECTFGHPQYRFPARSEIIDRLCSFASTAIAAGAVPVVFGYALGKAQEAMKILSDHGFALSVHASVMHMAEVYERHGIDFGDIIRFNLDRTRAEKRVAIMPPPARFQKQTARLAPARTLFLTGWALSAGAANRYGVDEVMPLSDHADFDGLLQYVEMVNPRRIYTTHGPRDFYLYLRSRGWDAHPLRSNAA